jgi:hypothetical protein
LWQWLAPSQALVLASETVGTVSSSRQRLELRMLAEQEPRRLTLSHPAVLVAAGKVVVPRRQPQATVVREGSGDGQWKGQQAPRLQLALMRP